MRYPTVLLSGRDSGRQEANDATVKKFPSVAHRPRLLVSKPDGLASYCYAKQRGVGSIAHHRDCRTARPYLT